MKIEKELDEENELRDKDDAIFHGSRASDSLLFFFFLLYSILYFPLLFLARGKLPVPDQN